MLVILLDSHGLIWWVDGDGELLSAPALQCEEREIGLVERSEPQAGLLVSAISCWEVERWLARVAAIPAVRLLPLEPGVAVAALALTWQPRAQQQ